MNKVYVGKIVNTHGIKGELRILSDFQFKDKVFIVNNKLIIDDKEYIIKSFRHHKNFEMVTLNDYKNINEVLFLLNKKVYIDKDTLLLNDNEILDEDLINYTVIYKDKEVQLIEIFYASPTNKILRVVVNNKEILIPFNSPLIKNIDKNNKIIYINLLDEGV